MTFSHGNRYVRNRLIEDAICGVWAGYSNDTLILMNRIEGNGQGAYGLERGGVNIEHGSGNRILQNTFKDNACGVHLWWDDDKGLLDKPGVKANHRDVTGNIVAHNRFENDKIALQLRDTGTGHVRDPVFAENAAVNVGKEIDAPPGAAPATTGSVPKEPVPSPGPLLGQKSTKMSAERRTGRDKIVMGEWGPCDFQSLFIIFFLLN